MNKPLTPRELYLKLLPLKKPMDTFKSSNEAALSANEVALMVETYPDILHFGRISMAQPLNGGCPSCIREAFHIFISVFDRMSADPHISSDEPEMDGEGKSDAIKNPGELTDEEGKQLRDLLGDLNDSEDADAIIARFKQIVKDTKVPIKIRKAITAKMPEMEKLSAEQKLKNSTELTEAEENDLYATLGLQDDATPQAYLAALNAYLEAQPEPKAPKLLTKQAKLTEVVATLPPVTVI